jgi:hypothetical protein
MKLIPSADRREGSDQIGLANAVKSMKQETSKALVKMENALQHGAFSRSLLIPGEDGKELQQHMETYREFYKSSGKVEQDIVDKLAFLKWRELRLEKAIASIQRTQMGETSKNLPEPVKKAMDEVKRIRETLHWYSEKIGTFRGVLKRSEDEANAFFISIYRIITGPMSVLHEEQTVSLQPQDEEAGLTLSSAVKGYSDFLEHRRGILHRRLRAASSTFRAVVEKNRSAMESVEAEASLLSPGQSDRLERERVAIERSMLRAMQMLNAARALGHGGFPAGRDGNYETENGGNGHGHHGSGKIIGSDGGV